MSRSTPGYGRLAVASGILAIAIVGSGPLTGTYAAAAAQTDRPEALSLTVTPAEVSLVQGDAITLVVVLRNGSKEDATEIRLTPSEGNDVVRATVDPETVPSVPAGGSTTAVLSVERVQTGLADTVPVQLVATYTQVALEPAEPGGVVPRPISQVTVSSFVVKAIATPAVAEAAFQANVDAVSSDRPADLALVVTNKRDGPVSVSALEISSPRSLETEVPAGALVAGSVVVAAGDTVDVLEGEPPIELGGRGVIVVPLHVRADEQLEPGARSLSVRIVVHDGAPVQGAVPEHAPSLTLVLSQAVKVEVFGESAILGALGVPMLLLLPGLIILTTLAVMLRAASPWRRVATTEGLDATTKAGFGVVLSVFISLLVALAYPTLTSWLPGDSRNLRKGYGFADFYYVYAWSFGIAAAVFAMAWIAWPLLSWCFLPRVDDEPRDLVRKLAFRGVSNQVDVVVVEGAAANQNLALHVAQTGGKSFVTPAINLQVSANSPAPDRKKLDDGLKKQRLFSAWRALQRAERKKVVTEVIFKAGSFIKAPQLVEPGKAVANGQPHRIVSVP